MIPNKTFSHKDNYVTTDLQRLAQKENFALFQLKGIQGQLVHLMDVPGIGTINVEKVRMYCVAMEKNIKLRQQIRKNKNKFDKLLSKENPIG